MNKERVWSKCKEMSFKRKGRKVKVLISYDMIVAAKINGILYQTERKFSSTTSRHISKAGYNSGRPKPQRFFDDLGRIQ